MTPYLAPYIAVDGIRKIILDYASPDDESRVLEGIIVLGMACIIL